MAESDIQSLRLQVANARPQDAGRGIARLGWEALGNLGLQEGQIIEIVGKRHTAAVAVGPYPEDEGLNLVRLDGRPAPDALVGMGGLIEAANIAWQAHVGGFFAGVAFARLIRR